MWSLLESGVAPLQKENKDSMKEDKMTLVKEIMQTKVISVDAQAPLWEAAQAMRANDIGDVFVTSGETITGILTDRDIAIRAVASQADANSPVVNYCSEGIISVTPEDTLEAVGEVLKDNGIRKVPVVDDGFLVGVLTLGDVVSVTEPASLTAAITDQSRTPVPII